MKKYLYILGVLILMIQGCNFVVSANGDGLSTTTQKQIITKIKSYSNTKHKPAIKEKNQENPLNSINTSDTNKQCPDFSNLRTTFVAGVFCQQVGDDGTFHNQKHYFYNTKTEKLVYVPGTTFIDKHDTAELKDLYNEYMRYAEKTNVCTCQGKKYVIPIHEHNDRFW